MGVIKGDAESLDYSPHCLDSVKDRCPAKKGCFISTGDVTYIYICIYICTSRVGII